MRGCCRGGAVAEAVLERLQDRCARPRRDGAADERALTVAAASVAWRPRRALHGRRRMPSASRCRRYRSLADASSTARWMVFSSSAHCGPAVEHQGAAASADSGRTGHAVGRPYFLMKYWASSITSAGVPARGIEVTTLRRKSANPRGRCPRARPHQVAFESRDDARIRQAPAYSPTGRYAFRDRAQELGLQAGVSISEIVEQEVPAGLPRNLPMRAPRHLKAPFSCRKSSDPADSSGIAAPQLTEMERGGVRGATIVK